MFTLTGQWPAAVTADVRIQDAAADHDGPGDVHGRVVDGQLRDASGSAGVALPQGLYRVRLMNVRVAGWTVAVEVSTFVVASGVANGGTVDLAKGVGLPGVYDPSVTVEPSTYPVTDGAPTAAAPDGSLAIDGTNSVLYGRVSGAWVPLTGTVPAG